MGLFTNRAPPNLPAAPEQYDRGFFNRLLSTLTIYFQQQHAVQQLNLGRLNFDLVSLPTEADLADLRLGDVYRDTTASNVLKVKV